MLYSRKQEGSEDKRVLKIDGAFAPKVLRFDSPFRAEGCGGGSAADFNNNNLSSWQDPLQSGFAYRNGLLPPLVPSR